MSGALTPLRNAVLETPLELNGQGFTEDGVPVELDGLTEAEANALYSQLGHTHTFASLTSKPTTIGGYGITDFNLLGDARWSLLAHDHTGVYQPLNSNLTSIAAIADPNADRLLFWDDSAGQWLPLTLGTNLSITGTTLDAAGGGGGSVATDTIWDAKGDLAVATGSDTATKLTVGANDSILMAASGQATGLQWFAPAAGVKTFWGTPTLANLNAAISDDDVAGLAASNTFTGQTIFSRNSAASSSTVHYTGTWFTGGTGTTTFPHLLLQATGTTASTAWSTAGTAFGINAVTGFTGNFVDFQLAGSSRFKITSSGSAVLNGGPIDVTATNSGVIVRGASGRYIHNGYFNIQGGIANGVILFAPDSGTAMNRMQFGTTTNSSPALGFDAVNGFTLQSAAGTATWNDSSTAASGTVANRYLFGIAAPTLNATNSNVTDTVASTVYIGGAPTAGTNTTIGTAYALNVAAGMTNLGGGLTVSASAANAIYLNNSNGQFAAFRRDQVTNDSGLVITFLGGASGAVQRGNFGFTRSGSGGDNFFASEPVDMMALRGENGIVFGNGYNPARMTIINGVQVGVPTGGDKGAGTLNLAGDLYKNNAAYTNPDYVFEHWATGKIEKFKDNDGASEYKGLLPLSELERLLRKDFVLPHIARSRHLGHGYFGTGDAVLATLEEAYLHIIALEKRITELENI